MSSNSRDNQSKEGRVIIGVILRLLDNLNELPDNMEYKLEISGKTLRLKVTVQVGEDEHLHKESYLRMDAHPIWLVERIARYIRDWSTSDLSTFNLKRTPR